MQLNVCVCLSLSDVQVSLTESVYNATEGDYVLICANINGSVERDLYFDIAVEPRTAQGE